MRIAVLSAVFISFGLPADAAKNLNGTWMLPNGGKAKVTQGKDGDCKLQTRISVGNRTITLTFSGKVASVALGAESRVGINGNANGSIPIRLSGKRCVVKQPSVSVLGELDGDKREFKAKGHLHGRIFCGKTNTWQSWTQDLTGIWR